MPNNGLNNKPQPHPKMANLKNVPHLSLDLHTMPQTSNSHFLKWLFLALSIFILMVLIVVLVFW